MDTAAVRRSQSQDYTEPEFALVGYCKTRDETSETDAILKENAKEESLILSRSFIKCSTQQLPTYAMA